MESLETLVSTEDSNETRDESNRSTANFSGDSAFAQTDIFSIYQQPGSRKKSAVYDRNQISLSLPEYIESKYSQLGSSETYFQHPAAIDPILFEFDRVFSIKEDEAIVLEETFQNQINDMASNNNNHLIVMFGASNSMAFNNNILLHAIGRLREATLDGGAITVGFSMAISALSFNQYQNGHIYSIEDLMDSSA